MKKSNKRNHAPSTMYEINQMQHVDEPGLDSNKSNAKNYRKMRNILEILAFRFQIIDTRLLLQ